MTNVIKDSVQNKQDKLYNKTQVEKIYGRFLKRDIKPNSHYIEN